MTTNAPEGPIKVVSCLAPYTCPYKLLFAFISYCFYCCIHYVGRMRILLSVDRCKVWSVNYVKYVYLSKKNCDQIDSKECSWCLFSIIFFRICNESNARWSGISRELHFVKNLFQFDCRQCKFRFYST